MNITPQQIKRLQVLYGQYEAHTLDVDRGRAARLTWASERCGRPIASFKDLTLDEGGKLIDTIQGVLHTKAPNQTPRKRMSRRDALNAGTAGRRDQATDDTVMVSASDLAAIQNHLTRLGWDQARLESFLTGPRSPLKGRAQIRTLADANKVRWALKRIPAGKEQLAASEPIAMMPHCKRDNQFELFETQTACELTPRPDLPFQRSAEIDVSRVMRILAVSRHTVLRMLRNHLLRNYWIGNTPRIEYDSVVEYCNLLRVHYRISEDRLLRKPARGRLRDEDLLPFPIAQTIYAGEVERRLDVARQNVIYLIEQGDLVGYQVLIDAAASPFRVYRPSLERYIASLHAQAVPRLRKMPSIS